MFRFVLPSSQSSVAASAQLSDTHPAVLVQDVPTGFCMPAVEHEAHAAAQAMHACDMAAEGIAGICGCCLLSDPPFQQSAYDDEMAPMHIDMMGKTRQ